MPTDPQPGEAADPQAVVPAAQEAPAQPSPLEELRHEFEAAPTPKRLFKRLPARKGRLVAEYKPLKLAEANEAIEKGSDPSILASALVGIHIADEAHPEAQSGLVPLGAWAGQPTLDPLRFDHRLAELLPGIPAGTAAEIALALFEGNDLALSMQADQVGKWSADTRREDLQDFAIGS